MGNGLIFPYWIVLRWDDGEGQAGQVLEILVEACRKGVQANPGLCKFRGASTSFLRETKQLIPRFQEKSLSFRHDTTVPETDTGGQVENTKALERTWVKELGKIAP